MTADTGVACIELCHRDARGARRQGSLREGVDLSTYIDEVGEERVLVGGDVETIGVGTDVGVIAEARAVTSAVVVQRTAMIRRAISAVVLNRHAVDLPGARWVRCVAN